MNRVGVDIAVVGGGIVGGAIAYGIARLGAKTVLLDGQDRDYRAAAANFGLVWQHGKGMNMPAYQRLTRQSVMRWNEFAGELTDSTGIDLQLEQNGGIYLCSGETGLEQRRAVLSQLSEQYPEAGGDWEMLDRSELASLMPKVIFGNDVAGASFGRNDGHANPLRLLRSLHRGYVRAGGELRGGVHVRTIERDGEGFAITFGDERIHAARVVIAAGLGSKSLAAQVGLDVPVRPLRGQILVTERVQPILPLPTMDVRQTAEGTVMIGTTQEEVGFNSATTTAAAAAMSAQALRQMPSLGKATLVRQWSGLRIMTPDGHPIYSESATCPGAFVAQCHSGVTLAAIHADLLARAVVDGRLPDSFDAFHQRRFDVPQAA